MRFDNDEDFVIPVIYMGAYGKEKASSGTHVQVNSCQHSSVIDFLAPFS